MLTAQRIEHSAESNERLETSSDASHLHCGLPEARRRKKSTLRQES